MFRLICGKRNRTCTCKFLCFLPLTPGHIRTLSKYSFTLVVCRKALLNGAALATRLGDSGAAAWYSQQFNVMTSRILDSGMFHFDDGSYRAYANPGNHNRKGIDSAVLLAILAGGASGDPHFGPAAPAVLASVKVYVDAFRGKYSIANSTGQVNGTDPVPTGRYPGKHCLD